MKKILFILFFLNIGLYAEVVSQISIKKPYVAEGEGSSLMTENQKNALKYGRGFYYQIEVRYIRPFLVNLETDEYYFYQDHNQTDKMSLTQLCKQNYFLPEQRPIVVTLSRGGHNIQENLFTFFPYEDGKQSCLYTSQKHTLPLRKYSERMLEFAVELDTVSDKDASFQMLDQLSISVQTEKVTGFDVLLDAANEKMNSIYIPLMYVNGDQQINAGLISLSIKPVASKIVETNFMLSGFPDFGNITLERLNTVENVNNKKRTLKSDIENFRTIVKNIDREETFYSNYDFIETMLDEYYLSEFDQSLVMWLIFNDSGFFADSVYYREIKPYLFSSNIIKDATVQEVQVAQKEAVSLPQMQELVEIKEGTKEAFNVPKGQQPIEAAPVEMNIADTKEPIVAEVRMVDVKEEISAPKILPSAEKNVTSVINTAAMQEAADLNETMVAVSRESEVAEETKPSSPLDYSKIPISAITMTSAGELMKNFGIALAYGNKARTFQRLVMKNDVSYQDVNGFQDYYKDSQGNPVRDAISISRDELATVLAPLKREKLGCWTKLATTQYDAREKKTVTLAEELKQNRYEMVSFYKDRNSSVGTDGYVIIYTNYAKLRNGYKINGIAFEKPTLEFYEDHER